MSRRGAAPLRVGLVLHGWPPEELGGTGLYVQALAAALVELGQLPVLLAPGEARPEPALEEVALDGIQAWRVHGPPPATWTEAWRRSEVLPVLRAWLRAARLDVLHLHHLSGLPLGLPRLAREAGLRVVLTLHDYALPCARGQLLDAHLDPCPGPTPPRCAACLGGQLALDPLTRLVGRAMERLPSTREVARELAGRKLPPARARARVAHRDRLVRSALDSAHQVLSPSEDLAARFAGMGLPRPRVHPLPLLRPVAPAPEAEAGPLRLLYVSSVIPSKGLHVLLEACEGLPRARFELTVAGPAPPYDGHPTYAEDMAARVAELGGSWRGRIPAAEVPGLLAEHDVVVLPSLWPENSPIVVREATAAGLLTVLSEVGGAAELDARARLVPPGDAGALRSALLELVQGGRRRRPPASWPTPREHAASLLREVYLAAPSPCLDLEPGDR